MLVSCIAVWSVFGFHTGVCGGAWVLVGSIFSGFAAFSWTLILVWDDPIWPSLRLRGSQVHQMLIISYQILEQDPHGSQDPTQETRSIWWGRSTSTKTTPSWKNGGASDYGGEMWKWLTYSCLHFFFMRLQAGDSWWRVLQLHCSILLYYFFSRSMGGSGDASWCIHLVFLNRWLEVPCQSSRGWCWQKTALKRSVCGASMQWTAGYPFHDLCCKQMLLANFMCFPVRLSSAVQNEWSPFLCLVVASTPSNLSKSRWGGISCRSSRVLEACWWGDHFQISIAPGILYSNRKVWK